MNLDDMLDQAERAIDESQANAEPLYGEIAKILNLHIEENGISGISSALVATRGILVRLLSLMPDHVREHLMDDFESHALREARIEGGALGIVETQGHKMSTKAELDEFIEAYDARRR